MEKESLNDLILNISLIDDDTIKANKIYNAIKIIDSYEIDEYKLYYLKGALWNLFPFDTNERDINIIENLEKSIKIDNDYIYSKTELSFYYFDKKEYLKVVKLLNELDLSFFENNGQLWKSLKLQELLLVSKLNESVKVSDELISDFLGLISAYLYFSEKETAVPRELVNAVIDNKDKEGLLSIIKNVNQLVNSKNQKDYFDKEAKLKLKMLSKGNIVK